jgi:hypothetical protein
LHIEVRGAAPPTSYTNRPPWRLTHGKQGKAFFFEKKKQKAFVCAVADLAGKVRVSTRKSFLVLSYKKNGLLSYARRPRCVTKTR